MKIILNQESSRSYPLGVQLKDDAGSIVANRHTGRDFGEVMNGLFDVLEEAKKKRKLRFPLALDLDPTVLGAEGYTNSQIASLDRFVRLYEKAYSR